MFPEIGHNFTELHVTVGLCLAILLIWPSYHYGLDLWLLVLPSRIMLCLYSFSLYDINVICEYNTSQHLSTPKAKNLTVRLKELLCILGVRSHC